MIKKSKGTHWILLFVDRNTAVFFDSFGIKYISQEVLNKVKDKLITHNIFRIPDMRGFICGFYCTAYVEYMLSGKFLLDYTNFFSPNGYKKNGKITYKYFRDEYRKSQI